jgi:rhodanese-related sulfurtransferase
MAVHDLAELELVYAPPYGSAKDPGNLAGMPSQNVLAGDVALAVERSCFARSQHNAAGGCPPSRRARARVHSRFDPRDRKLIAYCRTGQRSYIATRILRQHGFRAANRSGGYTTFRHLTAAAQRNGLYDESYRRKGQ